MGANKHNNQCNMANLITFVRIICSIALLFFPVFLLPITLAFIDLRYSAVVVCTIATVAAIQEGYHNEDRDRKTDLKTV